MVENTLEMIVWLLYNESYNRLYFAAETSIIVLFRKRQNVGELVNNFSDFRDRISNMVRTKRKSRRLTQEKLAEQTNLTTGFIGQIERGESMPSLENLLALVTALDMDPRALFYDAPQGDSDYAELCAIMVRMTPSQRKLLLKIAKLIQEDSP